MYVSFLDLYTPWPLLTVKDIDNKVMGIMDLSFEKSFWNRGDYPTYYQNGSVAETVTNPWYTSENNAAPFDQGMCRVNLSPPGWIPRSPALSR